MATTIGNVPMARRSGEGNLFLYMAILAAVIAFAGFAPTYWLPLVGGRLTAHPVIHLHGAVFFLWSAFFVWQAWLGASRRLVRHRDVGLIGISIATAMIILGLLVAIHRMHWAQSVGQGEAGRAFAIVPIAAIAFFAALFAAAIANVRHPDWHKRLMLVAGLSILDAPIARWFLTFLAPPPAGPPAPPPVAVDLGPSAVAFLLMLVAMLVDWRRHGRPHAAYVSAVGAFVALKAVQVPVSETAAWHAVAGWLMSLAG